MQVCCHRAEAKLAKLCSFLGSDMILAFFVLMYGMLFSLEEKDMLI